MYVWRSGIKLWSRASSRASASDGAPWEVSALATAIQHLLYVDERQPASAEQHREVVDDVRRLLGDALVGLVAGGSHDLIGLLQHLLAGASLVGEQRRRVRPRRHRVRSRIDRPLECGQGLVRGERLELAAVKAGPLARMASGSRRLDERQQRVPVAVVADRLHRLSVAGRGALVPQLLARAAVEVDLAGLPREPQRLGVHVRERQHLAAAPVLHHAWNQALLVECDLRIVHGGGTILGRTYAASSTYAADSGISGSGLSVADSGRWPGCMSTTAATVATMTRAAPIVNARW